jgi:MFS family permease
MSSESTSISVVTARSAGPLTFAAIFAMESFVRAVNATVVSLQAYDILGTSQRVSTLSTAVSLAVLMTTLLLPLIVTGLRRRHAYGLGAALMIVASLALASHSLLGQAAGMFLRNSGAAIMHVVLQLYILDNIKRTDLTRSEPLRLSLSTFSWMLGPAFGVWLYTQLGPLGPQAVAIGAAAILLAVFWNLGLREPARLAPERRPPFNPWKNVRRFAAQPRLRLAWTIAFGRSIFWSTFFIYGPLLLVEAGLGKNAGGLMISASQALLLSAYLFGRIARSYGVRWVVALSFLAAAVTSIAAGAAGLNHPYLVIGLLLAGSLAASALDGVGGIPYLRAVRPHERASMGPVYRTFIDFSDLIPSFVYAVALLYFDVSFVFVLMGLGLVACGYLAWRYLPRSL